MSNFIGIFKKEDNQFNICINAAVDTTKTEHVINKYEDYYVCSFSLMTNPTTHKPAHMSTSHMHPIANVTD